MGAAISQQDGLGGPADARLYLDDGPELERQLLLPAAAQWKWLKSRSQLSSSS